MVHRTSNELVEAGASAAAEWILCECECHRAQCGSSFHVTTEDYEIVRANGRQFVVTPGHEHPGERVVRVAPTYVVVEKHDVAGEIAEMLDPR